MAKRNPVTAESNVFFDSQNISDEELNLEQTYNDVVTSAIIANNIGSGILPEVLLQNTLFDSTLATGYLDGLAIQPQNQPSDNNFGNQLEINLINSNVAGRKAIKVGVIGLDFQSNLQYETFYFKINEIQVGKLHFTKILALLFNDFIGNPNLSLNLGGQLTIKEAKPIILSRDPIMVSQDIEPNLFFRDFFLDSALSLNSLLQSALPTYNITDLNIFTAEVDDKPLLNGDVTTQIGQKFLATTNNIQKAQLLLSVRNQDAGNQNDLMWNGDLIASIYPLQSNIDCESDIAPNLAIDFSPSNIPVAQISFNYASLQATGVILDSVPQPVDFVFSNSPIASGNILISGNYYVIALKRAGAANKCDILIASGNDRTANSRITTFTGTLWVDLLDQDLWFRVYTDAAKVSDGQGYESGHGIINPKTNINTTSLATVDYSLGNIQFAGNDLYSAVLSAQVIETTPISDQRTGNPVLSRKEFEPNVQLLNSIDLTNLEVASTPLIIGVITDKNRKFYDAISSQINSKLHSSTIVNDELIIRIVDDPTDMVRFDTSVSGLITNLLNGDFVGAQIMPNANNPSTYYRIASAELISGIMGDVDGNGIIDINDFTLLNSFIGFNLNLGLSLNGSVSTDGYTTTASNGYNTYIKPFSNLFGINFQLIDINNNVILSGADGVLVANPNDNRLANFTSNFVSFSSIVGLSSYRLVINQPSVIEDYGVFNITEYNPTLNVLTIQKIFLNYDTVLQMLRADIDGDFNITYNDGYLLQSYINQLSLGSGFNSGTGYSNPFSKIGARFNAIKFKLETFIDRTDDYTDVSNRASSIHIAPDIFLNDGYFTNHNFYTMPVAVSFNKQLNWDESLIVTSSKSKLIPSVFETLSGNIDIKCQIPGLDITTYEDKPVFDKGNIDLFAPDNLILGGQLLKPNGDFYKVDFEVGNIVLEIPPGFYGTEKTINIIDDFVVDYTGDGRTRLGFPSLKFADCSLVTNTALSNNQMRFSVSVQSFSPNTNGLSLDGYSGVIVDGKMGVSIDNSTGLLTLNFTNLYQDEILKTLNTKVQIDVYLKKGGFNNQPLFVSSDKLANMLGLISIFPPYS